MDLIKSGQRASIFFQKEENIVEISCIIDKIYDDRIVLELPQYFMRYIEFLNVGKRLTVKIFSKLGTIDFNTIVISSPLEDEFSIELDPNALKLTPNSEIPSIDAMEKFNILINEQEVLNVRTFKISTSYIKFYCENLLEVGSLYSCELILPDDYGKIELEIIISEIDPVYDNEYTATYSRISEDDRQKLLYYMYVYSNNID